MNLDIPIDQSVAILVDGNNMEISMGNLVGNKTAMINFDALVPDLLQNRALSRFMYFREGEYISMKLANRLQRLFHGSVVPCLKSADIPLTINAMQIAPKVDTIIIMSGDSDFVELIRHLHGHGVRVEVAAIAKTTSHLMIEECDHYFEIDKSYSFIIK